MRQTLLLAAGLSLVLAGCVLEPSSPGATNDPVDPTRVAPSVTPVPVKGVPSELKVRAVEYAFELPASVPAGLTRLTFENAGEEPHHLLLMKLLDGKGVDDLRDVLMGEPGPLPEWVKHAGGVDETEPGASATQYILLLEGEYALVCFLPSPDGSPHFLHGMLTGLTVTPGDGSLAQAPDADATIELVDFAFGVQGALRAGEQTIRFVNKGEWTHEAMFLKVEGDATREEVLAAMSSDEGGEAPPPAEFLGGLFPVIGGMEVYLSVDLEPGRYILVCFFDEGTPDHESHHLHGMSHEFTIP